MILHCPERRNARACASDSACSRELRPRFTVCSMSSTPLERRDPGLGLIWQPEPHNGERHEDGAQVHRRCGVDRHRVPGHDRKFLLELAKDPGVRSCESWLGTWGKDSGVFLPVDAICAIHQEAGDSNLLTQFVAGDEAHSTATTGRSKPPPCSVGQDNPLTRSKVDPGPSTGPDLREWSIVVGELVGRKPPMSDPAKTSGPYQPMRQVASRIGKSRFNRGIRSIVDRIHCAACSFVLRGGLTWARSASHPRFCASWRCP